MKRRGFLGLMGGAVVAGPSAATRATQSVLSQSGMSALGSVPPDFGPPMPAPSKGASSKAMTRLRSIIAKEGLPRWKELELRRDAVSYSGLDPELAALVSVSGGWKVREQRRRNFERLKKNSIELIEERQRQRSWGEQMKRRLGLAEDEYLDWY